MARVFNVREGFTRADDRLPDRLHAPLENGALAGARSLATTSSGRSPTCTCSRAGTPRRAPRRKGACGRSGSSGQPMRPLSPRVPDLREAQVCRCADDGLGLLGPGRADQAGPGGWREAAADPRQRLIRGKHASVASIQWPGCQTRTDRPPRQAATWPNRPAARFSACGTTSSAASPTPVSATVATLRSGRARSTWSTRVRSASQPPTRSARDTGWPRNLEDRAPPRRSRRVSPSAGWPRPTWGRPADPRAQDGPTCPVPTRRVAGGPGARVEGAASWRSSSQGPCSPARHGLQVRWSRTGSGARMPAPGRPARLLPVRRRRLPPPPRQPLLRRRSPPPSQRQCRPRRAAWVLRPGPPRRALPLALPPPHPFPRARPQRRRGSTWWSAARR